MRIRSGPNSSCKISLSKLPKEYQEVEYIQSSLGYTSHINSNIVLNQDSSVEIEYQFPDGVDGNRARLFGATDNTSFTGSKMYAYAHTSSLNDNNLFGYGNQYLNNTGYKVNNTKHHIKQLKNKLYFDGELIRTYSAQTFESYGNAYLFQNNNPSGNVTNNASTKIFMCKIWSGDNLVRDFIPCYRKSDNEIGMYDLIGKQFYTNQGTGTFSKGSNKFTSFSCKIPG